MRFPYSEREVDPLPDERGVQVVHEPVILVRFIGPSRAYLIRGLLDTGASMTLIPLPYMTRLGIQSTGRGRVGTASGRLAIQVGTIDLELRAGRTGVRWSARVGFVPRADNLALLGHAGFLDHFSVTFDGLNRQVTLRPNKTAPPPSFSLP